MFVEVNRWFEGGGGGAFHHAENVSAETTALDLARVSENIVPRLWYCLGRPIIPVDVGNYLRIGNWNVFIGVGKRIMFAE